MILCGIVVAIVHLLFFVRIHERRKKNRTKRGGEGVRGEGGKETYNKAVRIGTGHQITDNTDWLVWVQAQFS